MPRRPLAPARKPFEGDEMAAVHLRTVADPVKNLLVGSVDEIFPGRQGQVGFAILATIENPAQLARPMRSLQIALEALAAMKSDFGLIALANLPGVGRRNGMDLVAKIDCRAHRVETIRIARVGDSLSLVFQLRKPGLQRRFVVSERTNSLHGQIVNACYQPCIAKRLVTRVESRQHGDEGRMPVVQMNDVNVSEPALDQQLAGGGAEQGELGGIGGERAPRRIVAIDPARPAGGDVRMIEQPAANAAGQFQAAYFHLEQFLAKS